MEQFVNYATKIREIAAVAQTNPARSGKKSVNVSVPRSYRVGADGLVVFL